MLFVNVRMHFDTIIIFSPDKGEMYADQFQGLLRTESQGLPSRHTIGTSSPGTPHTAGKKVKKRHQKAEDTVVVLPAGKILSASLNNIKYTHREFVHNILGHMTVINITSSSANMSFLQGQFLVDKR